MREVAAELERCPERPALQSVANVGFHSSFAPQKNAARWVQVDLGREITVDSVVVVPACIDGSAAYGFPTTFRIETSTDALLSEPERLAEISVEDPASPLPYQVAGGGRKARYVRFTALGLVPQPRLNSRFIFCLGEMLVFSGGRNVALQCKVLAPMTVETLPTWSPRHLVDGSYALGIPALPLSSQTNGWHSEIFTQQDAESWVQVDLGRPFDLDEICLIPAHPRDYPDRAGFGFPRRFVLQSSLSSDFPPGSTVFDGRSADLVSPGDNRVAFAHGGRPARFIRVTASRLWERNADFVFALGELEAFEGARNVAGDAAVTSSDSTLTQFWSPRFLVDGQGGTGWLQPEETWLSGLARRRLLSQRRDELMRQRTEGLARVRERVLWLSGTLGLAGLAIVGFAIRRSRASRARDIEVLRRQISRDLHDEIGSSLCSIRLMAEMSRTSGGERPSSEALAEISRLAESGTEALRDMVWLLKEGDRPKVGVLLEKMRAVAASLLVKIHWSLEAGGVPVDCAAPLPFHRDVLFVFREALHNVVKHSSAASVAIRLEWAADEVRLSVADDGRGFEDGGPVTGDGLANMRHRAAQLKGTFTVQSGPGRGTLLVLKVPTP
jgi:signal transduction histidine kinase